MIIDAINNRQSNNSFQSLKKIRPHIDTIRFSTDEEMIAKKLKEYALKSDFFKENSVEATVFARRRQAVIVLKYHELCKKGAGLFERIKDCFKDKPTKECVIVSNDPYCTMEAAYKIAKTLRECTKEHSLDASIEKNKRIDIEDLKLG